MHSVLASGRNRRFGQGTWGKWESNKSGGCSKSSGLNYIDSSPSRTVDDKLWETIKPSGFASERFKLHLSPKIVECLVSQLF